VAVKVRDLIKTLENAGRIAVVSGRLGDDVRSGTYRAVLRQTGIKEAE
jgi:predicted RNA binding protein YcfA (HicA-like mRNA interferase family)